ncbi:ABC transporter ATP-binding protein [Candidatus Tisiphia endosymbiont of Myopa tessellatipennis]|uniref:ABC transporter ATP-binding protein n=1 Tax=Candidatus Tisiphia endosymbiont of Myopa tessellatipennis TaxID=3066257 RepID=UPI00313E43A6
MDESKIKIRSLYKSFGDHKVLDGIDLDIKRNSSIVILGGSGTGKSVLIKTIVGLMQADEGSIVIDEVETVNISSKDRFKMMKTMGFLFQGGALFDSLTVQDNITFFTEKLYKLSPKNKEELAASKLHSVGLSTKILGLYPSELSGGMQKRVSLARAICGDPLILFLDEPTTGLDPIMANVINELIIKVQEELKATTITITHDMNSAYMIAKEVAMIYKGKILWFGKKDEIKNSDNPYLQQFVNGLTTGPIEI